MFFLQQFKYKGTFGPREESEVAGIFEFYHFLDFMRGRGDDFM